MSFYQKLCQKMKGKIPESKIKYLPRSYQIIGRILLLKLKPEICKYKKQIGSAIMEILPYLQSVCLLKQIDENIRKPKVEIIAGSGTETIHKEHGCKFIIDVSKTMFSKGNKNEKAIVFEKVKDGETIIDMFAGIGYWSILLAKKNVKIYAIDINPNAIKYLRKNIELNKVSDKIQVLKGNCVSFAGMLSGKADRIIMGYIFNTEYFLPAALKMAGKKCIIHFHRNIEIEKIDYLKNLILNIGKQNNVKIKILSIRKIKSYAPRIWHIAMDLEIKKTPCKSSIKPFS